MKRSALIAICAAALIFAGTAQAALILTPAGIGAGFTLTTFATMNPGYAGCCNGPFGIAMASNGNVIVGMSGLFGGRYVFPDVDGQSPATALFTAGTFPTSIGGFANAGGLPYGSDFTPGQQQLLAFNDNGDVNRVLAPAGPFGVPSSILGMWGNPVNGHIIAQSNVGIIDINPLANGGQGTYSVISQTSGEGLTVSPDGLIVYSEEGSRIKGYVIATGALVYTSPVFPSPVGVGVISGLNPALNGKLVVNDNNGSIYLLDPVLNVYYAIASGGTRGDYIAPDLSNGTIFLDFSDIVARLGCGPGCSIGSQFVPSPEPANALMMATGVLLLGWGLRSRRRNKL